MPFRSSQTASAAIEVRACAAALAAHAESLTAAGAWAGGDAERFRARWHDEVTARVHAAAGLLDGIGFDDFVAPHA